MFMLILFCDNPGFVRLLYLLKTAITIAKFVIPIGLIVMITIDLYKNLINGIPDDKYNIGKKIGNRILAAIIVFLIPTLINLIFQILATSNIVNDYHNVSFANCYNEASLELVNQLEQANELKLQEQEEQARKQALIENQAYNARLKAIQERNAKNNQTSNGTYNSTLTDMNKQNGVYVQNGVFYKPKGVSGKDCPSGDATKKGYRNKYGYNDYFFDMLTNLQNAAEEAGYKFTYSTQGCRSYDAQVATAKKYANEPGRAAKPGNSNHGWGVASDLDFESSASRDWVHAHAKEYGLHFPLYGANYKGYQEPWHIEPINLKTY